MRLLNGRRENEFRVTENKQDFECVAVDQMFGDFY